MHVKISTLALCFTRWARGLSLLLGFLRDILEGWARGYCMHIFLVQGFHKDQVINNNSLAATKTTSGKQVDINNGLEYIEISCSLVKMSENINSNGKKSDVILTLPITSTQALKGSVQHYFDIESRVPIDKRVINKIDFKVTKNVGKVLLDLYIM